MVTRGMSKDAFITEVTKSLNEKSKTIGDMGLERTLSQVVDAGDVEKYALFMEMARDRIKDTKISSAFSSSTYQNREELADYILKHQKDSISEGTISYELRSAVRHRNFDVVRSILIHAKDKVDGKTMDESFQNAILGEKGNPESFPSDYLARDFLQYAPEKISQKCMTDTLNEIVLYSENLEKAGNVLALLGKERVVSDPGLKMFYHAAKGQQDRALEIMTHTPGLTGSEIMLAVRGAGLTGNKKGAMEIYAAGKDKVKEEDIKIRDLLQPGDYFFGTTFHRNWAIRSNGLTTSNWTADAMNNQVIETQQGPKYGEYKGIGQAKTDAAAHHFAYLEADPKYSPLAVAGTGTDARNLRVKRSCKGVVQRVIHQDTNNKVFFETEGFNPIKSLHKKDEGSGIAGSEFRKVVRESLQFKGMTDRAIYFSDLKDHVTKTSDYLKALEGKHDYKPKSLTQEGDSVDKAIQNGSREDVKKSLYQEKMEKLLNKPGEKPQDYQRQGLSLELS